MSTEPMTEKRLREIEEFINQKIMRLFKPEVRDMLRELLSEVRRSRSAEAKFSK